MPRFVLSIDVLVETDDLTTAITAELDLVCDKDLREAVRRALDLSHTRLVTLATHKDLPRQTVI